MFGLPWTILLPTLLGSVLAAMNCSVIGVFIVRMNLSSLGFAMSHAAFAGAALGVAVAVLDPVWMALLFATLAAAFLGPLADASRLNTDSIIGAVFPLTMALGLVFLNKAPSAGIGSGALSLLWGSVLGITMQQVWTLASVTLGLLVLLAAFGKGFLALLLDRKLALATGIPARGHFYAVLFVSAIVVSISLRITGGLLIYALMVLPASTALQWVYDIKKAFLLAPALGMIGAVLGFVLSLVADLPIGSSIALAACILFLLSLAVSPKRRRRAFAKAAEE
ncbi:metal ABC transporter permease [Candidatus Bipolaricaulota bacterium]|nr:metal ABC transporter permease [Candidatus Bipolaricaulota bacterium]